MPSHFPKLIAPALVLLATSVLAGCISEDGQIEAKSINLAYEGSQSGSHETSGACDSGGTLTGHGSVTDGSVRVRVVDGSGNTLFDETYTEDFTLPTRDVSGASGTWKIMGSRAGDDLLGGDQFQGSYSVTQRC